MSEHQRGRPGITLLLLALAAGIAWRAELEFRSGWADLAWLRYFHWAIPVFVIAFVAWVVWIARVRQPVAFALSLLAFAGAAYPAVEFVLWRAFATGISALGTAALLGWGDMEAGHRRLWVMPWIVGAFWLCIPLAFCALCRGFGVPIRLRAALLSAVLFLLSWPVAIFVRGFFEERGAADFVHALKSGFVIPFLILSLGLPLLWLRAAPGRASAAGEEAL